MGQSIVKQLAFLPPPATYNDKIRNFHWVPTKTNDIQVPSVLHRFDSKTFIIFTHGNAEDIGQLNDWAELLSRELKANVIAYDYRGYGLNNSSGPSEKHAYNDIRAVYKHVKEDLETDPKDIILFGRSLGTGITTDLASKVEDEIGGVILQSPITSCVRIVSEGLTYIPFTDMFDNYSKIHKIKSPLMISHGNVDEVVPFQMGERLWQRYQEKCKTPENGFKFLTIDGAGHNDIESDFLKMYLKNLKEFVKHCQEK